MPFHGLVVYVLLAAAMLLALGDKVAADLRVIAAQEAMAQEVIRTAESVPVEKGLTPVVVVAALGDRRSML